MNKNQKTFLLISATILITIFLYSITVYNFDYFRGLVLDALLKKDENKNAYAKRNSLLADIENNQATSSPVTATATTTNEEVAQPTFEFKMVTDPDPCTLNTLGDDGWEISQASTADLDLIKGLDENCRKSGSFPTLQWILFIRKH